MRKEEKIKVKLQQSVKENEDLLEMRKRIILTVSHDIRGPLGNIHNCADLASQIREKKKREPYLEDIRHSCHHILHLVNDLMDAYRINEAGDLRNDTPFYLDRFLQRISDEFSRKAVAKAESQKDEIPVVLFWTAGIFILKIVFVTFGLTQK